MDFSDYQTLHSASLSRGKDYAPALSIYWDRTTQNIQITVTDAEIIIQPENGSAIEVQYIGNSLEAVAGEISSASGAVVAYPLNSVQNMRADFLFYAGDRTPDGGYVIGMRSHMVKYTEETRIRLLAPYSEHRLLPWYPRVDRGAVTVYSHGVKYIFSVPEYQEQEWHPYFGAPFVDVRGEKAQYVNTKTIRLARTPIFWERNSIKLRLKGTPISSSLIKDVDVHNGIVLLNDEISRADNLTVDYVYREESLVYKHVNINPSIDHNPTIVDQAVLLYMRPTSSSDGQQRTRGVYHAVSTTIIGAISSIGRSSEPILVLGAYQVRPIGTIKDLNVTDTRTRGGGVKDSELENVYSRSKEAMSLADFGRMDGIPFPGTLTAVLTLEQGLKDSYGNKLIENRVREHLLAGGNILIEYTQDLD